MSSSAKKEKREFDDIPGEVTARTQAAINLVRVAKATGIFERLMAILTEGCGKLLGNATDSPRPGERRKDKWRGREKDTESEDPTNTDDDGESRFWDQKAIEGLRALEKKRRLRKQEQRTAEFSREE